MIQSDELISFRGVETTNEWMSWNVWRCSWWCKLAFCFFFCVCGLVTKFTVPDGWTNPSCPAYNWGQLGVSMDDKWWHGNLKVLPPFLWGVPGCRGTFPQMFIIKVVIVNGQKRQIEEIQHTTNLGCLPINSWSCGRLSFPQHFRRWRETSWNSWTTLACSWVAKALSIGVVGKSIQIVWWMHVLMGK